MDTKTLAVPTMAQDIERVLIDGDLSQLTPEQRVSYYRSVCDSLGMNPLTRPFDYLRLQGKLTLYAKREACDQIRDKKHISIDKPDIRFEDGLVIVTVTAHDRNGRTDSEIAALPVENLRGTDRANAIMKAVTKGKRRVTLSICGLGVITEDDVDEMPNAHQAEVRDNGEIVIHKPDGEWTEELDDGVPVGTQHPAAPPPGYVPPAEKVRVPSKENGNGDAAATLRDLVKKLTPPRQPDADFLRKSIQTAQIRFKETAVKDDAELRHAIVRDLFPHNMGGSLTELEPGELFGLRDWLQTQAAKDYINQLCEQLLKEKPEAK